MNQILFTKPTNNDKRKKFIYQIQLYLSFFIIIICIILFFIKNISDAKNKVASDALVENYNISKLYSKKETNSISENSIFGLLEIPSISLKYAVYSDYNDSLLKISPCKFYGKTPKQFGNICIAGHNYDNSLFFSNLSELKEYDVIYLFDPNGNKYTYNVTGIYEVFPSDLSPVYNYNNNEKTLTLITCNNKNNKRIIVKAKQ